ncbi:hypothetical protein TNCV_3878661 [Trichonephila clavipes]|nr:hypothetical protein TNCV_3878661 [Trichonephila clavipes]
MHSSLGDAEDKPSLQSLIKKNKNKINIAERRAISGVTENILGPPPAKSRVWAPTLSPTQRGRHLRQSELAAPRDAGVAGVKILSLLDSMLLKNISEIKFQALKPRRGSSNSHAVLQRDNSASSFHLRDFIPETGLRLYSHQGCQRRASSQSETSSHPRRSL